jgi:hypothetical protein
MFRRRALIATCQLSTELGQRNFVEAQGTNLLPKSSGRRGHLSEESS